MSSYTIPVSDYITIERHAGMLNDVSIDVQDGFDLDIYATWLFIILDAYDNVVLSKDNTDMTRTLQNLYFVIEPDELDGLIGLIGASLLWRLTIATSEGPIPVGMGEFIVLK